MGPAARPRSRLEALPCRLLGFLGGAGLGTAMAFFLFLTVHPSAPTYQPVQAEEEHAPLPPFEPPARDAAARAAAAKALILQVEKNAPADIRARCVGIIRGDPGSLAMSFSQAAQDWLLFHNYFFHIPYGQGTYLDIGSNHPLQRSNTYFFDKCLGWRGVCVEPNTKYHPLYEEFQRTCTLVKACVSDRPGARNMTMEGGVLGHLGGHTRVECYRLHDIVLEHSLSHAEFATIDIEGAEVEALHCFPFREHRIVTWLVETDKAGPELFRLFLRGGYGFVADVLCAVRALHTTTSRIGAKLDSIFRLLHHNFITGPPFLPGRTMEHFGPRGPCRYGSKGDVDCPEQVPVVEVEEIYQNNMTLRRGACATTGIPLEYVVPTSEL